MNMMSVWPTLPKWYRDEVLEGLNRDLAQILVMGIERFVNDFCDDCTCDVCARIKRMTDELYQRERKTGLDN